MTLEEEMAMAIIRGEKGTALILAQKLIEEHVAGRIELPPIEALELPPGRKKLILTVDSAAIEAGAVLPEGEELEELYRQAEGWLNSTNNDPLILVGFIPHLFVVPEPEQPASQLDMGTEEGRRAAEQYWKDWTKDRC